MSDALYREPVVHKVLWTPQVLMIETKEDSALTAIIQSFEQNHFFTTNHISWQLVAMKFNQHFARSFDESSAKRNAKRCRERWHQHLDPSLTTNEWSLQQASLFLTLFRRHPSKWSKITSCLVEGGFAKRSDIQIKNFFTLKLMALNKKINSFIRQYNAKVQKIKRAQYKIKNKYVYKKELSIERQFKRNHKTPATQLKIIESIKQPHCQSNYVSCQSHRGDQSPIELRVYKEIDKNQLTTLLLLSEQDFFANNVRQNGEEKKFDLLKDHLFDVMIAREQFIEQLYQSFLEDISIYFRTSKQKRTKNQRQDHSQELNEHQQRDMKTSQFVNIENMNLKKSVILVQSRNLFQELNNEQKQIKSFEIINPFPCFFSFQEPPQMNMFQKDYIRSNSQHNSGYSLFIQNNSRSFQPQKEKTPLHQLADFLSNSQKQLKSSQLLRSRKDFAEPTDNLFQNPFDLSQQMFQKPKPIAPRESQFLKSIKEISPQERYVQNAFQEPQLKKQDDFEAMRGSMSMNRRNNLMFSLETPLSFNLSHNMQITDQSVQNASFYKQELNRSMTLQLDFNNLQMSRPLNAPEKYRCWIEQQSPSKNYTDFAPPFPDHMSQ